MMRSLENKCTDGLLLNTECHTLNKYVHCSYKRMC